MPPRRRLFGARVHRRFVVAVLVTLTIGGTLTSDASVSAQSATTRFAWFYKPPLDSTSVASLAAAADELILTGGHDVAYREQLRRAGYRGRALQYIDLPYARGGGNPADASFSPWDNQVAWNTGDFAALIHPHEDWFLHGPGGQRCREQIDSNGFKYLMNPAASGWRNFVVDRIRWAYANWNYDGVFFDNVWNAPLSVGGLSRICGGAPREIAGDAGWRSATAQLLADVRALGRPVWINTDGVDFYGPHVDGWMFEAFAGGWEGAYESEAEIRATWARVARDAGSGKGTILVAQGQRQDVARFRFALAAYLLVAGPNVSFRYSSVDGSSYQTLWDYDEYGRSLGSPTGERRLVSGTRWRRDFTGGYVEVDLASHAVTIQQSGAPATTVPPATRTPQPTSTAPTPGKKEKVRRVQQLGTAATALISRASGRATRVRVRSATGSKREVRPYRASAVRAFTAKAWPSRRPAG
jgi:hypothetical protein